MERSVTGYDWPLYPVNRPLPGSGTVDEKLIFVALS